MYNRDMFYEVLVGRRFGGGDGVLTYNFDGSLSAGQIVVVPVGRAEVPGIVVKKVTQPNFDTKAILKILYTKPLPKHILKAMEFIADYYLAQMDAVVNLVLPNGVMKNRRKKVSNNKKTEQATDFPKIPLGTAQKKALESLLEAGEGTKLLNGGTGSGKTNIYVEEAKKALKSQKSVILLVPEIALTGQVVRFFQEIFGDRIAMIHSKQTEAERHLIFEELLNLEEPKIVIGPRSALFAPVANLGLIIIDEAHENTYYQENTPKYYPVNLKNDTVNFGVFSLE